MTTLHTQNTPILRIGTRASKLAVIQTQMVCDALHTLGVETDMIKMSTTGDDIQNKPLWDIGGKGLFSKQLDTALLDGACDICVHSAKDLETEIPSGVKIIGFLPRADVRDVIIGVPSIDALPINAVVGTCAPRRMAQIQMLRPDVKVIPIRGSVPTRLDKCKNQDIDATFLAYAGISRLGYDMNSNTIEGMDFGILDTDDFIPASAQGAIAITGRQNDLRTHEIIKNITCNDTYTSVMIERSFLSGIKGNCYSPIGVYAKIHQDNVRIHSFVSYANNKAYDIQKNTYNVQTAVDKVFKMGQDIRQKYKTL